MSKIRQSRSHDCLIFNMGIPYMGKAFFILRQVPGTSEAADSYLEQFSFCSLTPMCSSSLWKDDNDNSYISNDNNDNNNGNNDNNDDNNDSAC